MTILLIFVSCNEKEESENIGEDSYDDAYYAAQATVTSSDTNFTSSDGGGIITFKTEGGSVTLNVSCGCSWFADNSATDLFETSTTTTTLVVTAKQNTIEQDLSGTITLMTAAQEVIFATITITQSAYEVQTISVEVNEWNFPAIGALTTEIGVDASSEWEIENYAEWLLVEKTSTGISITATENSEKEERSTNVNVIIDDDICSVSETIQITQDGRAYVILSKNPITFGRDAQTLQIAVESNFDWDFSYDTTNDWCSIKREDYALNVTVNYNDSEMRTSLVILTVSDGAENVVQESVEVVQFGVDALVLTYETKYNGAKVTLPLCGEVDCLVDWGDGTTETISSNLPSHTYMSIGTYTVYIDGLVTALNSYDIASSDNPNLTLIAVNQWGMTGLEDMEFAFIYCSYLESIPTDTMGAFSAVTSFRLSFCQCITLQDIPSGLFDYCSNVTTFYGVFAFCPIIIVPDKLFDNCLKNTSFGYAFYGCSALSNISQNIFANCNNVTSYEATFYECVALNEAPSFNSGCNVVSFRHVFRGCKSLTSVNENIFVNCTMATDFSYAFYNCSSLSTLNEELFKDCTNAESFKWAFGRCGALKIVPAGIFKSCSNVVDFTAVFDGCTALESISTGLFDNCTMVTTFESAFYECKSVKTIPSGLFDRCSKVENCYNLFGYMTALEVAPAGLFDYCVNVTDFGGVFTLCNNLKSIPYGLFDKCSRVEYFDSAFQCCYALTSIPEGLFDNCPNVTSFSFTFNQCSELESIPEGLFAKCPNVSNIQQVLSNCVKLQSIPVDIFSGCNNITNFTSAFNGCVGLTCDSPYDIVDGNKVRLYERTKDLGYAEPSSTGGCFYNCTGLFDYYEIPSTWGGGNNSSQKVQIVGEDVSGRISGNQPEMPSGLLTIE